MRCTAVHRNNKTNGKPISLLCPKIEELELKNRMHFTSNESTGNPGIRQELNNRLNISMHKNLPPIFSVAIFSCLSNSKYSQVYLQ